MYTLSKGPSKFVAKTRRGLGSQNYEKFETAKDLKQKGDMDAPEQINGPRPVFQASKKPTKSRNHQHAAEEQAISPQHEEIINYINESWNMILADNPYDDGSDSSMSSKPGSPVSSSSSCLSTTSTLSSPSSTCSTNSYYCVEPPSPVLNDFKPFDLESWWGRRLFNNITKSL